MRCSSVTPLESGAWAILLEMFRAICIAVCLHGKHLLYGPTYNVKSHLFSLKRLLQRIEPICTAHNKP